MTLDTVRADALGSYGGPAWTTPTLDRLAREGVRFEQARTVAPITLPAHASLLTGKFPFEHGVRDNGTFVLADGANTLAERLAHAGYSTGAVVGSFVLDSSFGLAQGFEQYVDVPRRQIGTVGPQDERPAKEVVDEALRFLRGAPRRSPFFLWVHFYDAHWPYSPPAEVMRELPAEASPERAASADEARRRRYLGEVAAVDREIARLLEAVDRLGRGPVLLAVVADHGEGLGEHGEDAHSFLLYDSTLRIPLLLHHPSLPHGLVVREPVSIVDVAPTLLALLGLPAEGMSGIDLSPLLAGEGTSAERPIYVETGATWFSYRWSPLYALVEFPWKVIVGPEPELYDLAGDPAEHRNVVDAHPEILQRARRVLAGLARRTAPSQRRQLTEAQRDALVALGYGAGGVDDDARATLPPGWLPDGARDPRAALPGYAESFRAIDLWRKGRGNEAVQIVRDLVRSEPQNPHYVSLLGTLLVNTGRPAEALPVLRRAMGLSSAAYIRDSFAACLSAMGREDEAIRVFQETITEHPADLYSRLSLAELLLQKGRQREAIPHLIGFLDVFQGDPAVRQKVENLLRQARAEAR